MTRLNVKANVTAPQEINIPLVRGDHHETSGVFRVCFEVFLSLFSTLCGYVITLAAPGPIHYIGLAILGASACVFLWLSIGYAKRSREV